MKFDCPHCQGHIAYEAADAGQQGNCPHCENIVLLPERPKTVVIPKLQAAPVAARRRRQSTSIIIFSLGILLLILAFALDHPNARERDAIRLFNKCDSESKSSLRLYEENLDLAKQSPRHSLERSENLATAQRMENICKDWNSMMERTDNAIREEEGIRRVRFWFLIAAAITLWVVAIRREMKHVQPTQTH